ncbi:MAG: hypothetical protein AB1546_14335 [bacterium]
MKQWRKIRRRQRRRLDVIGKVFFAVMLVAFTGFAWRTTDGAEAEERDAVVPASAGESAEKPVPNPPLKEVVIVYKTHFDIGCS